MTDTIDRPAAASPGGAPKRAAPEPPGRLSSSLGWLRHGRPWWFSRAVVAVLLIAVGASVGGYNAMKVQTVWSAYAQVLHEQLQGEGIAVSQLIIGGAIEPGSKDKDPEVLAEKLWKLHTGRTTFRTQVSQD